MGWLKWALAWGGLLFDAAIVPLLLYRRTRIFAVVLSIFFHLFNSYTFRIGVFPYLALSLLVFFFPENRSVRSSCGDGAARSRRPHRSAEFGWGCSWLSCVYFVVQLLLPWQPAFFPGTSTGRRRANVCPGV